MPVVYLRGIQLHKYVKKQGKSCLLAEICAHTPLPPPSLKKKAEAYRVFNYLPYSCVF